MAYSSGWNIRSLMYFKFKIQSKDIYNLVPYPQIPDAADGIFSTIPDMLRYIKYDLNEKNELIALSHKTTAGDITDYAVGLKWQKILTTEKHKKIWQSGGTFRFPSHCVIYSELNMGIKFLTFAGKSN